MSGQAGRGGGGADCMKNIVFETILEEKVAFQPIIIEEGGIQAEKTR